MLLAQPFPPSKEKQFKHMKRVLQLNEAQAAKVKSILNSFEIEINELHQKIEAARMKDMEGMEKIKTDQEDQISKILNDDQKNKFDELNDEPGMPPSA
jgi:ATP-dependent Clp protease ATP-binding subunit ClpA